MRHLFILAFLLISFAGNTQYDFRSLPQKTDFGTRFHGNTSFSDGSFAAIGILEDGINNTSQMILVKWNCLGEIQWAKTLGGSIGVNNTNGAITEASNGDLVMTYSIATGWFNATMLVARFTQEGDLVWAKEIGLGEEYGRGITATSDGGFVAVGGTGIFGVDRARSDIYIVKLDNNGDIQWARSYGNDDAYDDAYHVIETSKGQLLVSGRYIVDGTFYNFLMRADADGNPLAFKGYGGPNHRNFGYASMELSDGTFLNTGYTTLAKDDFMSNGDCYLMKVDSNLNQIWAKVYEPQESDRNDFGFSLVLEEDGDYGICLESSSYRAISGPQAPNKNVIFSTDTDGNLKRVLLLNPKGSQYTKMSKAADGGYFITGFSTYYISSSTAPFNGFGFKTDADYSSGDCEEHDRTNQTITSEVTWDVQDISWEEESNFRNRDYQVVQDFSFDSSQLICSRIPEISVQILPLPDTICVGENLSLFANPNGGITDYQWDMGNGDTLQGQMLDYSYDSAGQFLIQVIATDGCQTTVDSHSIVVETGLVIETTLQLCPGDTLNFMDSIITMSGVYSFSSGEQCDSTFRLEVTMAVEDTVSVDLTKCRNETISFEGQSFDSIGQYFVRKSIGVGCDSVFSLNITEASIDTVQAMEQWCPGDEVYFKGDTLTDVGVYDILYTSPEGCDTLFQLEVIEQTDSLCQCDGFWPDAFTPNGDQRNDTWGLTANEDECSPINVSNFRLAIYNRWGDLIFETNNPAERWDGTIDGEECISEVYLANYSYIVNGERKQNSIDVTLLR